MRDVAELFAPGEILREEFAERGWTKGFVSRHLGVQCEELEQLLAGRSRVDVRRARMLSTLLGRSASLRLERVTTTHELDHFYEELSTLTPECVRFLYRRRWEKCRLEPCSLPSTLDVQYLDITRKVLKDMERGK